MTANPITCVIIDDEPHSIGVLHLQIEQYCPEVNVIETFNDSIDAYSFLKDNIVDIAFIDIEMPRLNGFELLSKIDDYSFKPVIVSAYDEFGIKAVKHNIFDYLVKPIDPNELVQTIQKFKELDEKKVQVTRVDDRILLPLGNQVNFVNIDTIIRCESDKNYTTLFIDDGTKSVISKTIKSVEEVLPDGLFVRVHNQHLINQKHIKSYIKSDGGYFLMSDESSVPLSRYKKNEVFKLLGIR